MELPISRLRQYWAQQWVRGFGSKPGDMPADGQVMWNLQMALNQALMQTKNRCFSIIQVEPGTFNVYVASNTDTTLLVQRAAEQAGVNVANVIPMDELLALTADGPSDRCFQGMAYIVMTGSGIDGPAALQAILARTPPEAVPIVLSCALVWDNAETKAQGFAAHPNLAANLAFFNTSVRRSPTPMQEDDSVIVLDDTMPESESPTFTRSNSPTLSEQQLRDVASIVYVTCEPLQKRGIEAIRQLLIDKPGIAQQYARATSTIFDLNKQLQNGLPVLTDAAPSLKRQRTVSPQPQRRTGQEGAIAFPPVSSVTAEPLPINTDLPPPLDAQPWIADPKEWVYTRRIDFDEFPTCQAEAKAREKLKKSMPVEVTAIAPYPAEVEAVLNKMTPDERYKDEMGLATYGQPIYLMCTGKFGKAIFTLTEGIKVGQVWPICVYCPKEYEKKMAGQYLQTVEPIMQKFKATLLMPPSECDQRPPVRFPQATGPQFMPLQVDSLSWPWMAQDKKWKVTTTETDYLDSWNIQNRVRKLLDLDEGAQIEFKQYPANVQAVVQRNNEGLTDFSMPAYMMVSNGNINVIFTIQNTLRNCICVQCPKPQASIIGGQSYLDSVVTLRRIMPNGYTVSILLADEVKPVTQEFESDDEL